LLARHGHDAIHTRDLPLQNATKDRVINQISIDDQRVVISKDTDFFYSHLLQGRPWKLLLVRTGNISTRHLRDLFERNLPVIGAAVQRDPLVDVHRAPARRSAYLPARTPPARWRRTAG